MNDTGLGARSGMLLTDAQRDVLVEAVSDYIYIYENHPRMVERLNAAKEVVTMAQNINPINNNVASLKSELAAALADIITYRRMRYADSMPEEARYRELTGHGFDNEE